MKILTSLSDFEKPKNGCVLAIGNFDGVHIGHQSIIAGARELAKKNDLAKNFRNATVGILAGCGWLVRCSPFAKRSNRAT